MNKITFLTALIASLFTINASAQKLVANDVDFKQGKAADLVISVESEQVAALVEFVLDLPQGITIESDADGYFYDFGEILRSSGRRAHSITVDDKDDGSIYVLVCDTKGGVFEAASGTLLSLPLQNDGADLSEGLTGTLRKIILSDVDANQMTNVTEVTFTIKDATTVGINDIKVDAENQKVYTVGGQRVVGKNLKKGIYVVDGTKVTVK